MKALFLLFAIAGIANGAANVSNYTDQGGTDTHIGGSLQVESGGYLDIESGGAFKIGGTTVTATAAQLNGSASSFSGSLTLENAETLYNSTDDTAGVTSNDEHMTFQVKGFEAKNAILDLCADECDDAADKYSLTSDTSNNLTLKNGSTSLYIYSSAGVMTMPDSETLTNASDTVTLAFDDAAANLVVKAFEATDASVTLQADESDDNGDDWKMTVAASGNALSLSNDTSGSHVAKLTVSTAGNVSMVGSLTGDGGDALSGFLQARVAATATTITAAQCGSTFYNSGAVEIELPEASTVLGCRLTFVTANAANFDVDPEAADQILVQTNAAGDMIRNATLGNSITIEATSASEWTPISVVGTWSDAN